MNDLSEKYKTYSTRYKMLQERIAYFFNSVEFDENMYYYADKQDFIKHIEMLNQALEALMDMHNTLFEILNVVQSEKATVEIIKVDDN